MTYEKIGVFVDRYIKQNPSSTTPASVLNVAFSELLSTVSSDINELKESGDDIDGGDSTENIGDIIDGGDAIN